MAAVNIEARFKWLILYSSWSESLARSRLGRNPPAANGIHWLQKNSWNRIAPITPMKIIDFHTHFFPDRLMEAIWRWFETHAWPIEYKQYADEAVATLKANGVERAVSLHYPHQAGMAESLNDWARRLGEKYPDFI